MASMNVDKHSCRRIQWNDSNGKRRTLRLGQLDDRTAKRIHDKVERLIRVKEHGEVDDESSTWLTRVDDDLYAKLAKVGVVEPREAGQLGPWLDGYLMERKELKPASRIKLEQTKAKLIAFFPADIKLRSITLRECFGVAGVPGRAGIECRHNEDPCRECQSLFQ